MRFRLALGGIGLLAMGFGGYEAVAKVFGQLPELVVWMAVPVLLTDALISPAVLALAWLGRRLLPREIWGPVVVGLVATGALTAAASVVLTRQGARPDLPSLLDRNYRAGYASALAVTWALTGVLCALAVVRARAGSRRRSWPSPRPGPSH